MNAMAGNLKKIPESVLVFGATGRVGHQVTRFLQEQQPSIRLRLVSSNEWKRGQLEKSWPSSEVVIADFFDELSLHKAVTDMEAVFVVTPGSIDEQTAMSNLVKALKESGNKLIHILRLVGVFPEFDTRRIPQWLVDHHPFNLPTQSPIARKILQDSLLPVTFLNTGTTFMENFFWMQRSLKEEHKLIWPSRAVPYMSIPDIGEIAARLLLSSDERHIGLFHTINNGKDLLRVEDAAEIMSRVWKMPISFDTTTEGFFKEYSAMPEERREYLWRFFQFEKDNELCWALNDCAERLLGRKPVTLEQWLVENQSAILGKRPVDKL
ncbi:hypothetical protein NW759_017156 [Fusarium solani]|nr:hypothetical protein NW759_017156 [Fusarium solani]